MNLLKRLINIWTLIIFMMIAPAKSMIGEAYAEATDHQKLQLQATMLQTNAVAGSFTINKSTNLSIHKNTRMHIKGDLNLYSDVLGEGLIVLTGENRSKLNANGNSIQRLMISNEGGVELVSKLEISDELIIDNGDLLLGDFDLVLSSPYAKLSMEGEGQVALSGNGRILGQSLHASASKAPQPDRDLGSPAYLERPANAIPTLYGTQVVYNINTDCETTFLTPPTPPPD